MMINLNFHPVSEKPKLIPSGKHSLSLNRSIELLLILEYKGLLSYDVGRYVQYTENDEGSWILNQSGETKYVAAWAYLPFPELVE
jgi:hypothetical protein